MEDIRGCAEPNICAGANTTANEFCVPRVRCGSQTLRRHTQAQLCLSLPIPENERTEGVQAAQCSQTTHTSSRAILVNLIGLRLGQFVKSFWVYRRKVVSLHFKGLVCGCGPVSVKRGDLAGFWPALSSWRGKKFGPLKAPL